MFQHRPGVILRPLRGLAPTQPRRQPGKTHETGILEARTDTRIMQDLLGHSIKTTEICTHVAQCSHFPSPLDSLGL